MRLAFHCCKHSVPDLASGRQFRNRIHVSKLSSSKTSKTDWKRVDALRDEEIDLSDIIDLTPEMFAKAIVRRGLVSTIDTPYAEI